MRKALMTIGMAACAAGMTCAQTALLPKPVKLVEHPGSFTCPDGGAFAPEYVNDPTIPPEGYRIKVSKDAVVVAVSSESGRFYAGKTLGQLAELSSSGMTLPCVEIEDAPKFRYRGVMIDEGRHFFGKAAIMKTLDLMAEYKLNVFHWHLTEDQGWRLEIKSHPELVEYGAKRPASPKRGTIDVDDGKPYGPFYYTQAEVREVVAYAKARHITIYPEIEMPGHTRALLAAHPELMCEGQTMDRRTPWTQWGICEDVVCVSNPKTLELVRDILNEVCELFPDAPYVHIGGEECTRKHWAKCARCQAMKRKLGLKDDDALQGWFTKQVHGMLKDRGKRLAGWSEMSWHDLKPPIDTLIVSECGGTGAFCAQAGYETVMAPTEYCYFYLNQGLSSEEDPYDYGWFWTGSVTVGDVYSFNPHYGVPAAYRKKIIGGEAHIWSEYTRDVPDMEWKLWPRGLALAEALWSAPEVLFEICDFKRRLDVHQRKLRSNKVNSAPYHLHGMLDLKRPQS